MCASASMSLRSSTLRGRNACGARTVRAVLGVLAISLGAPVTCAQAAGAEPATLTALSGGSVVDVRTGEVTPDAVVLIEGNRIKQIGPRARTTIPAGAQVVDMAGRWLIPGLMNMHVHLGLNLPGEAHVYDESPTAKVLRMASNARLALLSGVTTVRWVGEDHAINNGMDFDLAHAIDSGLVPGPRIFSAGELIVTTAGHGSVEGDGPAELARIVRTQVKRGARWIKIAISGGISDRYGAISAAPLTDEELEAVVEVAHRNGAKVTAHNGSDIAAKDALRLGVDGFEHGYHLQPQTLREMRRRGTWLVPTIVVSQQGALAFYEKIGSPPWYLERAKSVGVDHWRMLQQAIRIGVPIALGSDQYPHEPNEGTTATIREAELYVEAGMTPLQALQAATYNGARLLGIEQECGALAPGMLADIVAVGGSPLENLRNLRKLSFVMKDGVVYRNDLGGQRL